MAITSRTEFRNTLTEVINTVVGYGYETYEGEWKEIFAQSKTDRAEVRDVVVAGLGSALEKPEGEAVRYDTSQEMYVAQYLVITAALGFQLTIEAVEDDQYIDLAEAMGKSLGQSMGYLKDITGANVLNNAFSSSYLGGDGVSLANTAHPIFGGATFSNTSSTNADLSEESMEDAAVAIDGFINDRGLPSMAQIDKVVVPRQSKFIATRIMGNSMRPNTAQRDINALVQTDTIPERPIVNHFLTNTNSWYLTIKGPEITDKGLRYFQRTPMRKSQEPEFETGNYRYKVYERFAFGWTNPRGVWASQG